MRWNKAARNPSPNRLGSTPKEGGDTLPRVQRDTEAIVNRVFPLVSGYDWDVIVGPRGLSQSAVESILQGCPDEKISTDVTWALYLLSIGGLSLGYIEADGLEFETPPRYEEEIEALGGYDEWLKQRDAVVNRWAIRLEIARTHVEAMKAFQESAVKS